MNNPHQWLEKAPQALYDEAKFANKKIIMKENLNDLRAFLVVAREGSFTKAAAVLGVSQSALSHSIRGIEERLKIKLFLRTTRSVSTTEAGEQLYQKLSPLFDDIDREINELGEFRNAVRGRLRINGTPHVFQTVLRDKFARFLREYPEVELELIGEARYADIVAERFDAGIRLGGDVEKDMIAVRVSPDLQMCVAASPDYWAANGVPQTPSELLSHHCLRLTLPSGGMLAWEFHRPDNGEVQKLRPQGRLVCNDNRVLMQAALDGAGIVWLPRDTAAQELANGNLQTALDNWAISYPGYHLYYPNRRADSPLFQALIGVLRE